MVCYRNSSWSYRNKKTKNEVQDLAFAHFTIWSILPPSFYLSLCMPLYSTNNSIWCIALIFFILLSALFEFKNGNTCIFVLPNYCVLTSGLKHICKTSDECFYFHFIQLYTQTHLRYLGRKRKLSFGSVLRFPKKNWLFQRQQNYSKCSLTFLEHSEEWVHVNVCSVGLCAVCTLYMCTYCGTLCHCLTVTDLWYRSVVQ